MISCDESKHKADSQLCHVSCFTRNVDSQSIHVQYIYMLTILLLLGI